MGGGTRSGTPLETRGASGEFGEFLESFWGQDRASRTPGDFSQILNRVSSPLQRLGTDAAMAMLPAGEKLLASFDPFERRARAEGNASLAGLFGQSGARFGRSTAEAAGNMNAQLSDQFLRTRQEALFTQVLPALIQAQNVTGSQALGGLNALIQGSMPGPAIHDPGLLPSLLQLGGQLGGAAILASSQDFKEDITPRDDLASDLEKLNRMKVKNYRYRDQDPLRVGLVIEDEGTPDEIVVNKYVDLYSLMGIMINATKALAQEVRELRAERVA